MEVDKKCNSTGGPGRGVGFSLSLSGVSCTMFGDFSVLCQRSPEEEPEPVPVLCASAVTGELRTWPLDGHFVRFPPEEQPKASSLVSPAGW